MATLCTFTKYEGTYYYNYIIFAITVTKLHTVHKPVYNLAGDV